MKGIFKELWKSLKDPWYWVGAVINAIITILIFIALTKLATGIWFFDLL